MAKTVANGLVFVIHASIHVLNLNYYLEPNSIKAFHKKDHVIIILFTNITFLRMCAH